MTIGRSIGRAIAMNPVAFPLRDEEDGGGSAFSPLSAFGADLWTWLRPGAGYTLATVGEWRARTSLRSYAQTTQARRPIPSSGGVDYDGTDDNLMGGTDVVTSGAFTVAIDFRLDATPALNHVPTLLQFRKNATPHWANVIAANVVGYQPYTFFGANASGGALGVGIADALDTNRHRLIVSYDAVSSPTPGSYTAKLDGTDKTLVASGALAIVGTEPNSAGGRNGYATTFQTGKTYEWAIYSRVLTADERNTLDNWFANHTGSDPTSISGLVEWMVPSLDDQAGDCSALADQGPNGNHFANATLASNPYLDGTWAYADGKRAIRGVVGTSKLSHADSAVFSGATRLTLAFWIKQPTGAIAEMIGQLAPTDHSWWTYIHTTGGLHHRMAIATSASDTSTYGAMPGGSFTANTWTHVAWRYNGAGATNADRLQGFVNGAQVALTFSGTIPASLRNSAGEIDLFDITSAGLIGSLDDIIVIPSREVTDAEIARLASYYQRTG